MQSSDEARDRLVFEIAAGRCIAFVGAGFSMPVCRGWGGLLAEMASEASDEIAPRVRELLAEGDPAQRAFRLEVAAQMLEDAFATSETRKLRDVVRKHLKDPAVSREDAAKVVRRKELLEGIPFTAILTTNFDDVLDGQSLARESYAHLLRDADRRWLERSFWKKRRSPVLKLHGDLRDDHGITLSRRGYRTRLYAEPGYLNVLRTVFLTKTILFLGFSFTDNYLNELRSEVLAYVGHDEATPTLAYAVVPDLHDSVKAHYARHEGIEVFGYSSAGGHGYLDEFLTNLHAATNPARIMGERLKGKRILWADPSEQNNEFGYRYLREAADGLLEIDVARSPEEALKRLADEAPYDLVITRWGHHPSRKADAIVLLEGMRSDDRRVPVVVFASRSGAVINRDAALRLGVFDYASSWDGLFEVIDRRFC